MSTKEQEDFIKEWNLMKTRQEVFEEMQRWNSEFNTKYTDPKIFLAHTSQDWDNFKQDANVRSFYIEENETKNRIAQNKLNRSML